MIRRIHCRLADCIKLKDFIAVRISYLFRFSFHRFYSLDLTEFQKRDNMLRESSIAQDHWQEELKRIMQEERGE
jgi:hypothetical protein